ncbi:hypothetical protein NU10_06430 [Flavobacterium dauae]|uniref:hypothetical protein n=1 Tax=Flavobacterium dauae TaxID=1563479 RepID=UPI00272E772F|nr:hypothetical protein [Flavobacterium dauae]WLD25007.1 hypothetical protein NU10_06430 [Flavobacterium dauae]
MKICAISGKNITASPNIYPVSELVTEPVEVLSNCQTPSVKPVKTHAINALQKKIKKLYKSIYKVQKNSAIFATAFGTRKATFIEKKVKNKFG